MRWTAMLLVLVGLCASGCKGQPAQEPVVFALRDIDTGRPLAGVSANLTTERRTGHWDVLSAVTDEAGLVRFVLDARHNYSVRFTTEHGQFYVLLGPDWQSCADRVLAGWALSPGTFYDLPRFPPSRPPTVDTSSGRILIGVPATDDAPILEGRNGTQSSAVSR